MPKTIVILLDGTSNEIKANRSNILRLYGCLKKSDQQLVYYDPGVGTLGGEGAWSRLWQKTIELWGMFTGWGIDENVKDAYRFIIDHYDDGKRPDGSEEGRDRIFIFGFSRGAYSARVLAGFIHAFGLIDARNLNLLAYAYRAYKGISEPKDDSFAQIRLYERILRPQKVPIQCLGLFDTVSSVIVSGRFLPQFRTLAFTKANTSVVSVRHAVALDERRSMFRPQLWPEGAKFLRNRFDPEDFVTQDVQEVWFTGVHGDVGGGYPEPDSLLAKIPLHWMIENTQTEGLTYNTRSVNELVLGKREDRDYVAPDPLARRNTSMSTLWWLVECIPRRQPKDNKRRGCLGWYFPLGEMRKVPEGAKIHESVDLRLKRKGEPQPNLPEQHSFVP